MVDLHISKFTTIWSPLFSPCTIAPSPPFPLLPLPLSSQFLSRPWSHKRYLHPISVLRHFEKLLISDYKGYDTFKVGGQKLKTPEGAGARLHVRLDIF